MYIVLLTTSGWPSWPRSAPVEKDQTCLSLLTLLVLIWFSEL